MVEKSYFDLTEKELKDTGRGDWDLLRVIARNIARVADELHDHNYWMGEIQDLLCSIAQNTYLGMAHNRSNPDTDDIDWESYTKAPNCFICGKPVDMQDIGGSIFKSNGNILLACSECADKFDRCADLAASIVKF